MISGLQMIWAWFKRYVVISWYVSKSDF